MLTISRFYWKICIRGSLTCFLSLKSSVNFNNLLLLPKKTIYYHRCPLRVSTIFFPCCLYNGNNKNNCNRVFKNIAKKSWVLMIWHEHVKVLHSLEDKKDSTINHLRRRRSLRRTTSFITTSLAKWKIVRSCNTSFKALSLYHISLLFVGAF